ncbi:MAG: hypothetical protein EFT35_06205 [Methanophagales archaeon ANME-1-THS]|nr:MAG: hypothetical protein EFT35_06205 [Methanophagales archaeon ANME-1-THS]
MIVRIMGEGQFKVSSAILDRLNELDNMIVEAVGKDNEKRMRELLREMISLVKRSATPLDPKEIVESQVIIPPDDLSLNEARKIFTGEGIIPD